MKPPTHSTTLSKAESRARFRSASGTRSRSTSSFGSRRSNSGRGSSATTGAIDARIVPALGKQRLDEITPTAVQGFYQALIDAGVTLAPRRYVHAVLHSALEQAVKWRLLSSNPAHYVEKPKADFGKPFVWSPEQARTFLTAVQDDPDYPLWETPATTGLRLGEALALRWSDV